MAMGGLRRADTSIYLVHFTLGLFAVLLAMVTFGLRVGFNAATLEYGDLVKAGVIDPTKVVRTALQDAGIDYDSADTPFLPSVEIDLDEEQAKRVFRLIEALEDSDDVQDVYANYSVPDEIMEKLG